MMKKDPMARADRKGDDRMTRYNQADMFTTIGHCAVLCRETSGQAA